MVGFSLSACIKDILEGKVQEDEVQKIIDGTKFTDLASFDQVLNSYALTYWSKNPYEGKSIAYRFLYATKIQQPRVEGKLAPFIGKGWWKKNGRLVVYKNGKWVRR